MSDELTELRAKIAGSQVECSANACVEGKKMGPVVMQCWNCTGTGRVHRFGDALRWTCLLKSSWKRMHDGAVNSHKDCRSCQDRGWVPAENFFVLLLVEMKKAGWGFILTPATISAWPPGAEVPLPMQPDDLELDMYRAVLAVLEAAP